MRPFPSITVTCLLWGVIMYCMFKTASLYWGSSYSLFIQVKTSFRLAAPHLFNFLLMHLSDMAYMANQVNDSKLIHLSRQKMSSWLVMWTIRSCLYLCYAELIAWRLNSLLGTYHPGIDDWFDACDGLGFTGESTDGHLRVAWFGDSGFGDSSW